MSSLRDLSLIHDELKKELTGQEDDGEFIVGNNAYQCIDYYRKYLQGAVIVSADHKPWVVNNVSHGDQEEEEAGRLYIAVRAAARSPRKSR